MDQDLILDFEENPIAGINEANVLYKIWTRPKDTIHFLLKNHPGKYMPILLVLGGISSAISKWSEKNDVGAEGFWLGMVYATVGGALLGWIFYYIYAWALSATGKWLKGTGTAIEMRTVVSWSLIPSIVTLLLIVPEEYFSMRINDMLYADYMERESLFLMEEIALYLVIAMEVILAIWGIYISIEGVSYVQGFSRWKSFGNLILPILVLIIPVFIVVFIFASL